MPLSWVEVDLSAIGHNVRQLCKVVGPQTALMAVIKSNAYGHGLVPVGRAAVAAGAGWLGVICADEALALRQAGVQVPVFVMGPVLAEDVDGLLGQGVRLPMFDMAFARVVSEKAVARGVKVPVHAKVDTGLGRLSFTGDEAVRFVAELAKLPGLEVEGLYTHLADAEGLDQSYTLRQYASFRRIVLALEGLGVHIAVKHVAASAASMLLPELRCDLVRAGISIYGFWPAEETRILMASRERDLLALLTDPQVQAQGVRNLFSLLRPALSWKAQLVQVKTVPAQSAVGYGCTYRTLRETRVGVVTVGYADGFDRHLSNNGHLLVRGQRAPIIGRVCMNLCMIDVTDIPDASGGDEVVLIGRQGDQALTAEEMAGRIGTIHYEVVTRINWALPRVYHHEGQPLFGAEGQRAESR